jgi:hypothetical protein
VGDLGNPAWLMLAAGAVADRLDGQPVVFGEDAADPHVRGELVLREADRAAAQVTRRRDAALRVDVDAATPEGARNKHGDRDERRAARITEADHGRGQRHLRGVELAMPQHPEERLLDRQAQVGQVDAFRPHLTAGQRGGPVVLPAGQRQRHPAVHRAVTGSSCHSGRCAEPGRKSTGVPPG